MNLTAFISYGFDQKIITYQSLFAAAKSQEELIKLLQKWA